MRFRRNDGIDDIYKRSAVSQKYGGDLFHGLKGRSGAQQGFPLSAVSSTLGPEPCHEC